MQSTSDYTERLNHLRGLEDGWFEPGVGKKTSHHAIDLAERLLKKLDPKHRFGIFPLEDGSISLEIYHPRTLTCIIDEDGACAFTVEEIRDLSTEEGVSECAMFINKCLA